MIDPNPEDHLPGRVGLVTVPIPADGPGEIMVAIRGGTERFAAFSEEPIPKNASVVVIEVRSARSVDVALFPEGEPLNSL